MRFLVQRTPTQTGEYFKKSDLPEGPDFRVNVSWLKLGAGTVGAGTVGAGTFGQVQLGQVGLA